MILAVASGKGGTGKTTVSVNLARVLGLSVQLLDCDVEEPNANLFLNGSQIREEPVSIPVPEVDETICTGCGECGRFCEYHAIVSYGTVPLVFPELCHGCGGCALVCPAGAIRERDHRIGVIGTYRSGTVTVIEGRLDVGSPTAPPLVRELRSRVDEAQVAVIDAPPGTSCPVVASIRNTDFVLLVTEPTPFGLHDLSLAVELAQELKLPFGVVINRAGTGDDRVKAYCRDRDIPVLAEIPDDRRIAEAYSRGEPIVEALPEYEKLFVGLWKSIIASVRQTGATMETGAAP